MAPTQRQSDASVKVPRSILKKTAKPRNDYEVPLFPNSKKDKRQIKHAQLMSKITKPGITKPRRRRPSDKLITTLQSLTDALPKTETSLERSAGHRGQEQVNIISRKSMKSRPGAMKRRERLDRGERDRFAKNMAQMAVSQSPQNSAGIGNSSTLEKWTALRGFITQTLEERPHVPGVGS